MILLGLLPSCLLVFSFFFCDLAQLLKRRLPWPGGEPGMFWFFVYFISTAVPHKRCLGFCSAFNIDCLEPTVSFLPPMISRSLTKEVLLVFTKREPACNNSTMHALENQFNISVPLVRLFLYKGLNIFTVQTFIFVK